MITQLIIVSFLVFLLNIPFGYWRANVHRFSLQWVLAVHLPVPFIIALRLLTSIGFAWFTYVFLVGSFFLGQRFGAYLLKRLKQAGKPTTSCLVMDTIRYFT